MEREKDILRERRGDREGRTEIEIYRHSQIKTSRGRQSHCQTRRHLHNDT